VGAGTSFLVIAFLAAMPGGAATFTPRRPAVTRLALPTSPRCQPARPVTRYPRFPQQSGRFAAAHGRRGFFQGDLDGTGEPIGVRKQAE